LAPYVVLIAPGEPETGLWCNACLLPSAVRVPLIMITESGASDTALSPVELCTECGKQELTRRTADDPGR
jgi:hypothetical protein